MSLHTDREGQERLVPPAPRAHTCHDWYMWPLGKRPRTSCWECKRINVNQIGAEDEDLGLKEETIDPNGVEGVRHVEEI